jgi:hypothetical protein
MEHHQAGNQLVEIEQSSKTFQAWVILVLGA